MNEEPAIHWCECGLHHARKKDGLCGVCDPKPYSLPSVVRMQFDPDTPSDRLPDDVYQRGETTV